MLIPLLIIANHCSMISIAGAAVASAGVAAAASDSEIIERCANILSLVFVHGDSLTRELLTAISTGHTTMANNGTYRYFVAV